MSNAHARPNPIRLAIWAIILHALFSSLHGASHQSLGVKLSVLQVLFVAVVITIAPIVAGIFLWKDAIKVGAVLLACSMTGSLIFGAYNHFVAISPDHVSHLTNTTSKNWIWIFQATAVGIAAIEVFGIWVGMKLYSNSTRK